MSSFSDEVDESMRDLLFMEWDERDGQTVPKTNDVSLKDGAVRLDAVYLYADLGESTRLQKEFEDRFAAKIMRMYLHGACKILRWKDGHIKSFDGDRVMAIFVGKSKKNDAVEAALALSWLVNDSINPLIVEYFEKKGSKSSWTCTHGVGVDTGEALIVRAGVRNPSGDTAHNDLISIGRAPNIAAKLSALREPPYAIWITADVYSGLNGLRKFSAAPAEKDRWVKQPSRQVGPHRLDLYSSAWRRRP